MCKEFKVGDLVRVWKPKDNDLFEFHNTPWVEASNNYGNMDKYDGKVGIICNIDHDGDINIVNIESVYTTIDENVLLYEDWYFNPSWLTHVDCYLNIIWRKV